MPLNTGAALAVSLIPAAVILVYNLMETGVPGGALKNFINKDLVVSGSASYLAEKNASAIANSSAVENFIESVSNSIQTLSTVSSSIVEKTTTTSSTTVPTTSSTTVPTTSSTTVPTTARTTITTTIPTTTTTTTTPAPISYPRLPLCCGNVHVSGDRMVGHCGNTAPTQDGVASKQVGVWNAPANIMSTGSGMKFTLQTSSLSCKDGKFIGQLPLSSDVIISDDHFLSNGMLKYKNEFYQSDQFCIRGFGQTEDILEVQICKVNCSNPASPCVHKCCGYDEIYSMGMKGHRGGCLRMDPSKNESMWTPTLYDDDGTTMTSEQLATAGIRPHIIQSNPTRFRHLCPRNATTVFPHGEDVANFLTTVLRYPFSALKFKMRKDGFLISDPNVNSKIVAISKTVRTTKFCIDGVKNYGESVDYLNLEDQTVLFLCLGGPEELTTLEKGENLVVAASSNQPKSEVTAAPSTTTSSTTTTTTTTTTPPTTTSTTPQSTTTTSTTTPKPTTTTTTTTTTTPTTTTSTTTSTTTTPKPTSPSTTTTTSTTTKPPTTTTISTTPATTTTTEPPTLPPVLPVCCPLDPDAEDEDGNEISHHCKFSGNSGEQIEQVKPTNTTSDLWIASPNFMFTHKITKFRLEVNPLKCQKWTKVFVHNLGKLLSPTEPVLMPNGMLKMGNDYYRNREYCVNGIFPNIVEVLVCKTNCSDPQTPCIQKCCAPNEIYSLGVGGKKRGCVPLDPQDTPFDPPLHKDMNTKVSAAELEDMTPHLVQKYPPKFQYSCFKNVTLVFPFSGDVVQLMSPLAQINLEFKLRRDGKIIYKHPSIRNSSGDLIESAFSTSSFCVDGIRNFGKSEPEGHYKNFENQNILFVCAVKPPSRVP